MTRNRERFMMGGERSCSLQGTAMEIGSAIFPSRKMGFLRQEEIKHGRFTCESRMERSNDPVCWILICGTAVTTVELYRTGRHISSVVVPISRNNRCLRIFAAIRAETIVHDLGELRGGEASDG